MIVKQLNRMDEKKFYKILFPIYDGLVKSQHHPSTVRQAHGSGLRVNPAKRGITY